MEPALAYAIQHTTSVVVLGLGLIALSGALFHLRQQVAFVPSSRRVVQKMLALARPKHGETIVDLGAGDARFLITAMRLFPECRVLGYEGAWWVWLLGWIRLRLSGGTALLLHRDFFSVSLRDADVVCCYLSIPAMKRLLPKLIQELKPGARVVSHAFSLPGIQPTETVRLPMPIGGEAVIRLYTVPFTM
ncbi:MAG: SAM-dependent methyltransferase [Candidatus Peribacteraceae bacterium]